MFFRDLFHVQGMQFYTDNIMEGNYEGKFGRKYGKNYGLCLESYLFPNAINHNNFISPILKKNKIFKCKFVMKFKNDF